MNLNFPQINYPFWLSDWGRSIGQLPVYRNKNLNRYVQFDGDINLCTEQIFELTRLEELNPSIILRVVDLIYSWGGPSGRMFYAKTKSGKIPRAELEQNSIVFEKYLKGIQFARGGKSESIELFSSIIGIGPSYASKHSYFWSLHSKTPLIIVDSKIAGALGFKTIYQLEQTSPYSETVKEFVEFSKTVFQSEAPYKIERALFAFHNYYFLNNNEGWKNQSPKEDFEVANEIALKLFGTINS